MTESPASPSRGCLLVASPQLLDPNFARTVVLVISHGAEGSFGLVLNRPLGTVLGEMLPEIESQGRAIPVLQGGPVQTDLVQFVSRCAASESALLPGVSVGASLEDLRDQHADAQGVRCYVGYSGWGAGQLEAETAEGSWIVAPARAEHVFDVPAERLWAAVLRELGGQYAWLTLDGRSGDN